MRNRKILAMVGVSAMMIGLVACGSKAESNIAESATPAPTAEATPTPEPTEEPAESHDFDSSVNKYKSESDIEIKQYSGDSASDMADCDSGTDIEDIDTLYDWLYSNGVTRESVQNDRDSGCKNPYLDGYLEYLDNLDKPSEDAIQPVSKSVDLSNATVHSGSEFGMVADVYEVDGKYYIEDGHEVKYDTKYNEWYIDMSEDFAGVQVDKTSEEIAADNKKAEEDTQKAKDAFNDPAYNEYVKGLVEKYGG